jgi:LuxR family transcriptional regulator, maltose regulon positive regulatory protein
VDTFPLRTKLNTPPVRPGLIPRSRLYAALERGLQPGVKLILVSAPAGSGKTSLLSDWLAQAAVHAAWLSLDVEDNDPARFWGYVARTLAQAVPELSENLLSLVSGPPPFNTRLTLTVLFEMLGEWAAEAHAPLLLGLDDFHLISNSEIQAGVNSWIEQAPANLKLLISTRFDPPIRISRLRVGGGVVEIRQEDLRFNAAEAQVFLQDVMALDLCAEDVASLLERTEGWAAGLQLAALSIQPLADRHSFIQTFNGNHRHIADYLMEEVFHQIPAEIQDFLLSTSILARFDAGLCDAVTGRRDSRAMLFELERTNLFLVPLDTERCWYRYHHLFGEHLRHRLRLAKDGAPRELHLRAAHALAEAGQPSEAIGHALAAQEPRIALRIIETEGDAQWSSGGLTMLIGWLEALPKEVLYSSARACILYALAIALNGRLGQIPEAEKYLAAAQAVLLAQDAQAQPGAEPGVWGMWHAADAVLAAMQEHPARVKAGSRKAMELLAAESPIWRGLAAVGLGHACLTEGDVASAIQAYQQAILANRQGGNLQMAARAQIYLAIQRFFHGELREAERLSQEIIAQFTHLGRVIHPMLAGTYLVLAWVYTQWDRLDEAESLAARARQLGAQWENVGMVYLGLQALAHVYLGKQDYLRASGFLDEAEHLARCNQTIQTYFVEIDSARVRIELAQAELDKIRGWLAGIALDADLVYEREPRYLVMARAHIALGETASALALLDRLAQADEAGGRINNLIEVRSLQALALWQSGQPQPGLAAFAQALEIGAREGYRRIFLDEGAAFAPLYRAAIERGVQTRYAGSLLAALKPEPALNEAAELTRQRAQALAFKPALVEPLTVREIEILKLVVAGKSNPQIASALSLSINTVKVHIKNIYGKLGVESRTQAIVWYHAFIDHK